MATQTVNLPYDTSTVANYKAIMSQFGTALAAFGWIQTADSGQVTWSGVSTLPGNLTYRDYEVWRMNDTAQSTTPVYVKLEYSTQATNCPIIRVTIGTSSNGSGTITGTILLSAQTFGAVSTSGGASNNFACYYSGNSGRLMFLMYEGMTSTSVNVPYALGIERSRDTSGNATTDYVVVTYIGYDGNQRATQRAMVGSVVTTAENKLGGFICATAGSNNFNGTTGACPQMVLVGKLGNPLLNFSLVPAADAGEGATVTVNIYGATHTYIVCKAVQSNQGGFGNAIGVGSGTTATLCLYE